MKNLLIILTILLTLTSYSQSLEGVWETYNDESGELKSEVKIYLKNGKLYGKIIKLHNLKIDLKDAKCYDCKDYRKNQPVLGMEIISGLTKDGKYWEGDEVLLDPNNGKVYDAKLWITKNNELAVRGYIGLIYRTQYWKKK
ncbi:DUF2147 domain-containing protein [Brumimicrobium aurantiacum]|uniref:DUF2147 domain-containing protein n=1 Tax=Brumimicrobium aurantiacum TaxID=1737063 RepID=A0A3E1EWP7_9FLAO|nr:DUF2147 domain-containing protein [Brumimicrobium aurantiacum]RFC53984.1 DUF2147 domain-containing protein [Brumimicrobium aurantiacum]